MCSVCDNFDDRPFAGIVGGSLGPVAQLVERLHGMEEVARSIRVGSTEPCIGPWALAGFVAGEGCFGVSRTGATLRDGSPRLKSVFQVTVATRDRPVLEALRDLLGCGSLRNRPPGSPLWLPTSVFAISFHTAHRTATIPFAEAFLLPCAKRVQFERWRDTLDEYERLHPNRYGKGPSPCSAPGCDKPVRGRGLCRSHYYRATGY